jgi:HAD superfamily hydrolase (TIGR01549 family)
MDALPDVGRLDAGHVSETFFEPPSKGHWVRPGGGSIDPRILWNFERARTIRPTVSNGIDNGGGGAVFETHARTSFLFDLDGTLVDSVYQHVLAWRTALSAEGINLSVWRIHRKIGMSGGLFTSMLLRETGYHIDPERIERLRHLHAAAFNRDSANIQLLPGARELLAYLTHAEIPWAIATSGRIETARPLLAKLDIDFDRIPIVTRDQVKYAKPDPDLFLAAAARLRVGIETALVVGDSVWDMLAAQRARALGVGLLSGGYGRDELERAGACRVYEDPADLLRHIDEVGGRNRGADA